MTRVLHRYLLREMAGPFGLILCVFLFVLLMGRMLKIVEMILRQGVNAWEVIKLLAYLVPSFLPLAVPMATLIAGVICFSRLSADMEITAMKASGISLYQMLPPVAGFSVVMFLVTLFLTLEGAPWGSYAFTELAFQMARKHISMAIKEGVFNELIPGLVIYAERFRLEEGIMERVFVNDRHSSKVPMQITAGRGEIRRLGQNQEAGLAIRLENGTVYQASPREGKLRQIHFDLYELEVESSMGDAQQRLKGKRPEEWDIRGLISNLKARTARGKKPSRELVIEIHRRIAIPVGCLIYGILSLPLAIQSSPRSRSHGFVLGMCAIVSYYLLFAAGRTLAETGAVAPWLGIWGANMVFGAITMVLLGRAAKEKPTEAVVWINAVVDVVQRFVARNLGSRQ
ncbi:MAG: LPS export ABC transporter permease LptF [Thermodesulfobacteriota bacterium]